MSNITEKLAEIRKGMGLKQGDLGQRLGLPQSHISKVERGEVEPRIDTIIEWSNVLGHNLYLVPRHLIVAVEALLEGRDASEPMWKPDEDVE